MAEDFKLAGSPGSSIGRQSLVKRTSSPHLQKLEQQNTTLKQFVQPGKGPGSSPSNMEDFK